MRLGDLDFVRFRRFPVCLVGIAITRAVSQIFEDVLDVFKVKCHHVYVHFLLVISAARLIRIRYFESAGVPDVPI